MKTINLMAKGTFAILALILFSCSSGIVFPPVSNVETGNTNQGQFIWHDLAASNPKAAMDFYHAVFGWDFQTLGEDDKAYHVVLNDGKPIGGIFKLDPKYGNTGEWISSISVNDVEAMVTFNEALGGRTIFSTSHFKGRGITSMVQDPQGALVALLNAEGGDPEISTASQNEWLWNELWTTDLEASLNYYKSMFQYDFNQVETAKAPYYIFVKEDQMLAGAIKNPIEGGRSSWMPYIRVADVQSTVGKARSAGASILMEPNQNIRNGTVAVILDPMGAQFTVQEWSTNN